MAGIRQAKTRPEALVAADLRAMGIRYRRNVRSLPGSPDFANVSRRWAIFVNGCFWHQHTGCRRATIPKSNAAFWQEKFRANRARDARAINHLRARGFKVLVVWECSVRHQSARLRQILEPRGVNPRKP
jgi:DNA mismatch endonuclease Vsr